MMMKYAVVSVVVAVCLLVSAGARATEVLDQYQEQQNGVARTAGGVRLAQTFTAGRSGVLRHVDLNFWETIAPPFIEISGTTGVSGGVYFLGGVDDGWYHIPIFGMDEYDPWGGIPILAGQMYIIVVGETAQVPHASVGVRVQWEPSPYLGGQMWSRVEGGDWVMGDGDMQFRTYVDPIPAPGAILLGTLGAGLVGWLRRRTRL